MIDSILCAQKLLGSPLPSFLVFAYAMGLTFAEFGTVLFLLERILLKTIRLSKAISVTIHNHSHEQVKHECQKMGT